jgi:hypothetical protein
MQSSIAHIQTDTGKRVGAAAFGDSAHSDAVTSKAQGAMPRVI